jgi:hypothetical protein
MVRAIALFALNENQYCFMPVTDSPEFLPSRGYSLASSKRHNSAARSRLAYLIALSTRTRNNRVAAWERSKYKCTGLALGNLESANSHECR